jgi:DNA-binding MurR/RpiR family transcriptional regulator
MDDRLLYEREHRMNSKLISDNSMLRAVHQDDKAKIARLTEALREAYQITHYGRGSMQDVDDVLERAIRSTGNTEAKS